MPLPSPLKSELLMPAGSLDKLKTAILYGADAVYMGTPDMSLRTKSTFTLEQVVEGIEFAHSHGKKVYLTLNLFTHNKDVPKLAGYLETVRKVKPDGLIIADPGVFQYVKTHAPELELHISTQANICSWLSVDFWKDMGASLCVLAREVTFQELTEIRKKCPDIKLETFVHGAMCMTYSGRCLLSNFMAERGANQGNCANSCRWNYKVHMRLKDGTETDINLSEDNQELFDFFLEEGYRPGEFLPFAQDERGSYILNAKDLCLMPKLDKYLELGIDSLKIEGRNKSIYYVGIVTRAYRMAMNDWEKDPENWQSKQYMKELETVPNRGYSLAFHDGRLTNHAHNYEAGWSLAEWEFAGTIHEVTDDAFIISVKNRLDAGDVLEFIPPYSRQIILLRIYEFENYKNGNITDVVHAGQLPMIRIPFSLFDKIKDIEKLKTILPPLSIIRKERAMTKREWSRVKLDKESLKIEMGGGSDKKYTEKRDALVDAVEEDAYEKSLKTPRLGVDGCCGKGCNGCLIFWNDPSYEKARKLLSKKKQGEMFDTDMIEIQSI